MINLVSIPVPGLAQLVMAVLLNFISFDVLLTDFWVPKIFRIRNEEIEMEGGLN
jgi:hypothetical protein